MNSYSQITLTALSIRCISELETLQQKTQASFATRLIARTKSLASVIDLVLCTCLLEYIVKLVSNIFTFSLCVEHEERCYVPDSMHGIQNGPGILLCATDARPNAPEESARRHDAPHTLLMHTNTYQNVAI